MRYLIILLLNFCLIAPSIAIDPDIILDDPVLEARARKITSQLRCPTCVSQSVDSSNVGISKDLQILVREQIIAGRSDKQIYDYLSSRYGDFVLLKPRMNAQNALLWFLPAIVFLGVFFILVRRTIQSENNASHEKSSIKFEIWVANIIDELEDLIEDRFLEHPNSQKDNSAFSYSELVRRLYEDAHFEMFFQKIIAIENSTLDQKNAMAFKKSLDDFIAKHENINSEIFSSDEWGEVKSSGKIFLENLKKLH